MARAFPAHAASGWVVVPGAPSAAEIVRAVTDHDADGVRTMTAPLVEEATMALDAARRGLRVAPASLWPAYGYAALVRAQLRCVHRDPFAVVRPGFADRVRLVLSAVRGSI